MSEREREPASNEDSAPNLVESLNKDPSWGLFFPRAQCLFGKKLSLKVKNIDVEN